MAARDRALLPQDMAVDDQVARSGHCLLRHCLLVVRDQFRAILK
jgi:hypothetical protein